MADPPVFFVTGGLGFLGQFIVQALHDSFPGSEIRVQARTKRPVMFPFDEYPEVKVFHTDLVEPANYRPFLQGVNIVVHCAAMVSFKKSDREAVYRSNVTATELLLENALQSGVADFIYVSSISTVAKDPPRVSDETMIPIPEEIKEDAYGYTKLLGELKVNEYAERMRVVSLNPSVILGPGSMKIDTVKRALRIAPLIPMIQTMNSFVDVRDVARAVVLAIQHGKSGERYIITSWNLDMISFVRKVLQAMGKRALVIPISGAWIKLADWIVGLLDILHLNPGIKKISDINIDKVYTSQKAREELGWEPVIALERTLRDTL